MDSDCLLLIDDLTHMSHTLVTMMAYLPSKTISGLDQGVAKPLWWDLMTPIWQIASFDSHWRLGEQKIRITWEEIEVIKVYQQCLMKSICIFSIYTLQEWQNCDDEMIRHPPDQLTTKDCFPPERCRQIGVLVPVLILTTQIQPSY